MSSKPVYCSHIELKRVYPQIDSFDTKTPIYGWTKSTNATDFYDSSLDGYHAHNTGLITEMFWDGSKMDKIAYNTTETTKLDGVCVAGTVTFDVDSTSSFAADDIFKIDDEYFLVVSITDGNTIVSNRGMFGTATAPHADNSSVYIIVDVSADATDTVSDSSVPQFMYDPDLDMAIMIGTQDPADYLVEAGEDFTTMITQFRTDASRYLDSKLDPNLPSEQLKDDAGDYDYIIIRSASLIAAAFLIRATDPTNEIATALMEEAQGNIDALNNGGAALSWQTTRDASRGVIRDITYTDGYVRPVDLRGIWNGTYDIIKVKITMFGVIGTCKYSVWVKSSDKLGLHDGKQVVTDEIINGDYQPLAGGLQIRFAGKGEVTAAILDDEWQIEVSGAGEHIDSAGVKSVANSRWLN